MEFIFEYSNQYRTSERSERVRYRFEHEKINSISPSAHVLFVLLNRYRNKPNSPVSTVPKKDIIILLPYLGLPQSNQISKEILCIPFLLLCQLQNTRRIKSFFPYKDRLNRSQQSKVIYKAGCRDCNDFYVSKTKRQLHDRKLNTLRPSLKLTTRQPLLTMSKPPDTKSSGIILKF